MLSHLWGWVFELFRLLKTHTFFFTLIRIKLVFIVFILLAIIALRAQWGVQWYWAAIQVVIFIVSYWTFHHQKRLNWFLTQNLLDCWSGTISLQSSSAFCWCDITYFLYFLNLIFCFWISYILVSKNIIFGALSIWIIEWLTSKL